MDTSVIIQNGGRIDKLHAEAAAVAAGERTPSRTRVEAGGMGKAAIFDPGVKGVQGERHPSNEPRCALAEGLGEPEKWRRKG